MTINTKYTFFFFCEILYTFACWELFMEYLTFQNIVFVICFMDLV